MNGRLTELFARFKKDLEKPHMFVVFKQSDGTKNTRYFIKTETETHIYVAVNPNDFKTNQCSIFKKDSLDDVLTIGEECR